MKKIYIIILLFLSTTLLTTRYLYAMTLENLIVIDPGHGGSDGGSVGLDGTLEKVINLQIAKNLKLCLEDKGFNVILTRDGDYDLASLDSNNRKREDIHKRVKIINESGAVVFLSIHANSYPNGEVKGAQVFYKKGNDNSKFLGEIIQGSIQNNLKNTFRKSKEITNKYLIDYTSITGVLIEVGFLSNQIELENLKNTKYQNLLCAAICDGVIKFINESRK